MQIWRWDGFFESLLNPYVLEGAIISICLTIGSLVIGLLIGIGIALMRLSGKRVLSSIAAFYCWFFRGTPLLVQLHAFIIFVAAFVLLLPLPPGTNFPPALCIILMAGGLLERDGRFILAGYLAFALNVVFFALFALYGQRLIQWGLHLIAGEAT